MAITSYREDGQERIRAHLDTIGAECYNCACTLLGSLIAIAYAKAQTLPVAEVVQDTHQEHTDPQTTAVEAGAFEAVGIEDGTLFGCMGPFVRK